MGCRALKTKFSLAQTLLKIYHWANQPPYDTTQTQMGVSNKLGVTLIKREPINSKDLFWIDWHDNRKNVYRGRPYPSSGLTLWYSDIPVFSIQVNWDGKVIYSERDCLLGSSTPIWETVCLSSSSDEGGGLDPKHVGYRCSSRCHVTIINKGFWTFEMVTLRFVFLFHYSRQASNNQLKSS